MYLVIRGISLRGEEMLVICNKTRSETVENHDYFIWTFSPEAGYSSQHPTIHTNIRFAVGFCWIKKIKIYEKCLQHQ